MSASARPVALEVAWQSALAAEHQAVFGYSLLGPQLSDSELDLAITCSNEHETLRNTTETAMTSAGLQPVQSRADYPALYPVTDAAAAVALAVRLEDACSAGWRWLYVVAAGHQKPDTAADRSLESSIAAAAQLALTACAMRATRWLLASGADSPTTAFPGIGSRT